MRCLKSLFCILVVVSAGLDLSAQQITASVRGNVSDPSGAVVQEATVAAKQAETGLIRTATSARDGSFLLVELPVGHYTLEVTAKGFKKYVQEGITLDVNQTAMIPVRLAVGIETQAVEVTADAQLIQTTTSSLGLAVTEALRLPFHATMRRSAKSPEQQTLRTTPWKPVSGSASATASRSWPHTLFRSRLTMSRHSTSRAQLRSRSLAKMISRRIPSIWQPSAGVPCSTRATASCSAISGVLPSGNEPTTWYQHVLGNWQFNGIVTVQSGTPFTVFDSTDVSLQGQAPEISGF